MQYARTGREERNERRRPRAERDTPAAVRPEQPFGQSRNIGGMPDEHQRRAVGAGQCIRKRLQVETRFEQGSGLRSGAAPRPGQQRRGLPGTHKRTRPDCPRPRYAPGKFAAGACNTRPSFGSKATRRVAAGTRGLGRPVAHNQQNDASGGLHKVSCPRLRAAPRAPPRATR